MDKKRLDLLKSLFDAAVNLPPEDRDAFLKSRCADDQELYDQLKEMVDADTRENSLLDGLAVDNVEPQKPDSFSGRQVGAYRILHEIASGGMGQVFLAERTSGQFQQQVALKIIKQGPNSEIALKRFRDEIQIMARLQHPNIARLYDGGINEDGLSYFTMEYIEGEPIDTYCDTHKLSIRQRLRLFLTVCAAVQYAHRNLIVHRDIKPGNILVTDGGMVKLLDFGIAKALAAEEAEPAGGSAALTQTGMYLLTPEYAAPEQTRGDPVTTATDVYSLGMVLYELLTGRRPYELPSGSPAELERIIGSTDPVKPSTAIRTAGTGEETTRNLQNLSRLRDTHPGSLRKELAGDLDNICLKALRKEPERRYDSAGQLKEDIERHLNGFPVRARTDTFSYRTGKFIRRYRAGLMVILAVFLLTGSLTAYYTYKLSQQRDLARLESHKAAQVSQFLINLFEVSDPGHSKGETITARELLDRGAARIEKELVKQPEVQATLYGVIGEVYSQLGLYKAAEPLFRKAIHIQEHYAGRELLSAAKNMDNLAMLLKTTGRYQSCDSLLQRALKIQMDILGPQHPDVAQTISSRAALLHDEGDAPGSIKLYRKALGIWKENPGEEFVPATIAMNDLALLYHEGGLNEKADSLYRKALKLQRKLLGDVHPEVATTLFNLAQVTQDLSKFKEAEEYYREVLSLDIKLLGPDHPTIAFDLTALARIRERRGNFRQADSLYRQALDIREKRLGNENLDVLYSLDNLGAFLTKRGKLKEAEAYLHQALETGARIFGDNHPQYVRSQYHLASVLKETGRLDSAEALFRRTLQKRRELLGDDHPYVAHSQLALADLLLEERRFDEAEKLMNDAMAILHKKYPTSQWQVATGEIHLAQLYLAMGDLQRSDPIYRRVMKVLSTQPSMRDGPERANALAGFGRLLLKEGKPDSARSVLEKVLRIQEHLYTPDNPRLAITKNALGACLVADGQFQRAEAYLAASYPLIRKRYGSASPITREAQQRLQMLYRKWGRQQAPGNPTIPEAQRPAK